MRCHRYIDNLPSSRQTSASGIVIAERLFTTGSMVRWNLAIPWPARKAVSLYDRRSQGSGACSNTCRLKVPSSANHEAETAVREKDHGQVREQSKARLAAKCLDGSCHRPGHATAAARSLRKSISLPVAGIGISGQGR